MHLYSHADTFTHFLIAFSFLFKFPLLFAGRSHVSPESCLINPSANGQRPFYADPSNRRYAPVARNNIDIKMNFVLLLLINSTPPLSQTPPLGTNLKPSFMILLAHLCRHVTTYPPLRSIIDTTTHIFFYFIISKFSNSFDGTIYHSGALLWTIQVELNNLRFNDVAHHLLNHHKTSSIA